MRRSCLALLLLLPLVVETEYDVFHFVWLGDHEIGRICLYTDTITLDTAGIIPTSLTLALVTDPAGLPVCCLCNMM